ncbi:MAG: acireductone synthase [Myxococcota bacterium]
MAIRFVLVDIEGTTSSIDFVKKTLFPYSRERLPDYVRAHADERLVRSQLALVDDDVEKAIDKLLEWLDEDRKATPLKTLQGMVWRVGYEDGSLRAHMYADTPIALRTWRDAGLALGVYSSGSVAAQKLMFKYSEVGDLTDLFKHHFDTTVGKKIEPESYGRILAEVGYGPREVTFLSDSEAELDAASSLGISTIQIVRPEDGTPRTLRHRTANSMGVVNVADL